MNICRITNIAPDGKPWESQYGPMYPFYVTFADNACGQVNSKTEVPPYKVGDEVGYEITGSTPRGGAKLKIDRKADPTKCRNTTPQDSHPDLEAAPAAAPKYAPSTRSPVPANPSPQAGKVGESMPLPLSGQTIGMATKAAVDIWLATLGAAGAPWDDNAPKKVEGIARQIIAISQRIEGDPNNEEDVPF